MNIRNLANGALAFLKVVAAETTNKVDDSAIAFVENNAVLYEYFLRFVERHLGQGGEQRFSYSHDESLQMNAAGFDVERMLSIVLEVVALIRKYR